MDGRLRLGRWAGTGTLAPLVLALAIGLADPVQAAAPPDLDGLREQALAAVNSDRAAQGLDALSLSEPLNAAAQDHAADMLARGYFEHASPEGETVDVRYARHDGPPWHVVAENLAQCRGCPRAVDAGRIRELQAGWMNSPGHRRNILTDGLARFGFGVAVDGEELYAVQTFAGPGVPAGSGQGARLEPVSPRAAGAVMLASVNDARRARGQAALEPSDALRQVAENLLPDDPDADFAFGDEDLVRALPAKEREAWAALGASTASCGGCGTDATAADLRHFTSEWLDGPQTAAALLDPSMTHLGAAVSGNGDGRKLAVVILGRAR